MQIKQKHPNKYEYHVMLNIIYSNYCLLYKLNDLLMMMDGLTSIADNFIKHIFYKINYSLSHLCVISNNKLFSCLSSLMVLKSKQTKKRLLLPYQKIP